MGGHDQNVSDDGNLGEEQFSAHFCACVIFLSAPSFVYPLNLS